MVCVRSTFSGNRLSIPQALNIARNAGFQGLSAYTFVAVEMAESGLDVGAICYDSSGTRDEGIAQINSTHGFGGSFDPAQAAAFSYGLSNNGTDFSPWATYTGGQYQAFLPQVISGDAGGDVTMGGTQCYDPSGFIAVDPIAGNCPPGFTKRKTTNIGPFQFPNTGSGAATLGGVPKQLSNILDFLTTPKSWLRIAAIAIGIGLILIGGFKLLSASGGTPKPANIQSPQGRPAFSYLDVKDPNA